MDWFKVDWLRELARRIRMLLRRDQAVSDIDEEMQLHLDLRRQQQIESGVPANDAAAAAHRRFGNPTLLRERSYTAWGWQWLETLLQDMLYGLRAMLRSPGITIVALLSLALGIGANTALFSLMDAVMLRSLPVKNPQQLMLLGTANDRGFENGFDVTDLFSYPVYRQFQQRNRVFSDFAAVLSTDRTIHGFVEGHSAAEPMTVQLVSGTYFSTLGLTAMMGRAIDEGDDRIAGSSPVAVISNSWWRRKLGSDPTALGRTIQLNQTTFTIVGIAPPEFFGTEVGESPDIWVPVSMVGQITPHSTSYTDDLDQCLLLFGRLRPGVTLTQAETAVNLLRQQILPNLPDARMRPSRWHDLKSTHIPITPMARGFSDLRKEFSGPLKVLMVIVGLVLLIACANIANLLLARSTTRARELAVRQALGANRVRLVRQLFTESLLLAVGGGVLGTSLAQPAMHLLLRLVSRGSEAVPLDVSLSMTTLLFTLGITVLTAMVFGVLPAFRAVRLDLTKSLKDGRGAAGGAGSRNIPAKTLIVSQVAFSLVLVVAAGLFLRTLANLTNVSTGFNKENVLRLDIDAISTGYAEDEPRLQALYKQIEERVSALPGVHAVSFSSFVFHEGAWFGGISLPDGSVSLDNSVHNIVGNGYFRTMQIPLLTGRTFGAQDTTTSPKVAVISEQMARILFPKGSPLGRHYLLGGEDREIIGVVKDVRFAGVDQPETPIDYIPYLQRPGYLRDFEVRYTGDFGTVTTAVQRAIHEVDPHLPISRVTTLDEQVARSYTDQRVVAQISAFFGLLAVFLSAIGIYGLMSYVVSRRTNEIGIRMALGAARTHVRWLVLREVLILVAIGVAIGAPAALLSSRLVASMLFGLHGNDPLSVLAAILVMLLIAALAGYLPARRASRVDPMVALRYE
jgi:predicted permease